MTLCKDCTHWKKYNRWVGNCNSDRFIYAPHLPQDGNYEPIADVDMLIYTDPDEYEAWFRTGPLFGCIHFKEKEAEK